MLAASAAVDKVAAGADAAGLVETVVIDAVVPESGAESAGAGAEVAATPPEVSPATKTTLMSTDAARRLRRPVRTDLLLSRSDPGCHRIRQGRRHRKSVPRFPRPIGQAPTHPLMETHSAAEMIVD